MLMLCIAVGFVLLLYPVGAACEIWNDRKRRKRIQGILGSCDKPIEEMLEDAWRGGSGKSNYIG